MSVSALPMSSSARRSVSIAQTHDAMPSEPARAVSSAMSTLRRRPQLKVALDCVFMWFEFKCFFILGMSF